MQLIQIQSGFDPLLTWMRWEAEAEEVKRLGAEMEGGEGEGRGEEGQYGEGEEGWSVGRSTYIGGGRGR